MGSEIIDDWKKDEVDKVMWLSKEKKKEEMIKKGGVNKIGKRIRNIGGVLKGIKGILKRMRYIRSMEEGNKILGKEIIEMLVINERWDDEILMSNIKEKRWDEGKRWIVEEEERRIEIMERRKMKIEIGEK